MKNRRARLRSGCAAASVLALSLVAMSSSGAPAATTLADVVPSGDITVQVLSANGSGCPAGTASVRPAADHTGFTVSYTAFTAEAGPGTDPTDIRKNCQLSLLINVPQGFTFAIARADYIGTADLAKGAIGTHKTNYYLQGSSVNNNVTHTFTGPMDGLWAVTDAVVAPVYAPCNTSEVLNVNTQIRVSAAGATPGTVSTMSMNYSSGSVNSFFHFSWQQC
jgi:hypothetical protein